MSVAEPANTTYPAKFREKENGFAIMESRSITHWKRSIRMGAWIMREENDGAVKYI